MSNKASDILDEELTSYLDGELTPSQSASLEIRLVDDALLRRRLSELRQTYDMLDELPETPHNQSFTQSTIAMVVADLKKASPVSIRTSEVSAPAPRSNPGWTRTMLTIVGMLVLGCLLGAMAVALQTKFELSNLDFLANLSGLQDTRDLEVVQDIAKDEEIINFLWERYSDRTVPLVPESLWNRRSWVLSLNSIQVAKLESNRELFSKLPIESRGRLEAIQTQIDSRPEADALNRAIRVIGDVFDSLPNNKRQDVQELDAEQRTLFLREQLCFRAATLFASELSPADSAALDLWSKNELLPILVANMPFLRREVDVRTLLMSLYSFRPIEDGYRLENQSELVANLANALSPFPKRLLEGIDRNDQLIVIATWLVPDGINNIQRMIDTYEKLGRQSRDELDLADPDQSKRLLRDRSRRPSGNNRNR